MARLGTNSSKSSDDDYSRLSLDDLRALQQRATQEIEARRVADRDKVIQQIRALADDAGLEVTISSPGRRGRGRKGKDAAGARGSVPVKYQHPQNEALRWTGRGRKPAWIVEWEAAHGSLEKLSVTA